ncbi:uncharacterized protein LOC110363863 isoform X2 [Columba livia]|uniref:uncharacterized protein LOC110363863 isoform X2 n=1 Tax=Columba livia TaxID=8932 RepID=UPI0031BA3057
MGDGGSEGLSARGDDFGGEHLEKGNPPGSSSPGEIRKAVEQCLLSSSRTLDVSGRNIEHLTDEMYRQPRIKYFHLERNVISTIPEDLFQNSHVSFGWICGITRLQLFLLELGTTVATLFCSVGKAIENAAFREESHKRAARRAWQFVWDVSMDLWYHVIPVSDFRTLVLPGAAAGPIPCCSLINGTPSKTRTRLVCSQRVVHARCRCVFIRMLPRGFQQIMAQSHSCSVSLNHLSCNFSAISE